MSYKLFTFWLQIYCIFRVFSPFLTIFVTKMFNPSLYKIF